jgi:penicillin amidase
MKLLRKLFYALIIGLLVFVGAVLIYLTTQKPQYNGSLELDGLNGKVEVVFDYYGIPHIYAENEEDAYFALGYVHAQDRLFQMEMTRRVASGRLAEILGTDFVKIDAFFKTLGLEEHADASAKACFKEDSLPFQRAADAYLKGLNSFIRMGRTPVEFVMLGIDKAEFTRKDILLASEFMAFNFAMAFRTDPLMSYVKLKLGKAYYEDLTTRHAGTAVIPVYEDTVAMKDAGDSSIAALVSKHAGDDHAGLSVLNKIPVPFLTGSNGWVVAPSRSKSGKVLLGNDTHIGFGQPAVWYEAHLEYPGHSFYGNFLAGFPFAAIGHTREIAWGLTMLENDDADFYAERIKPGDSSMYWSDGQWRLFRKTRKTIHVKGEEEVPLTVLESRHGPMVHQVMPEWKQVTDNGVALQWTHLKFTNNLLQVTYDLSHAKDMEEFRRGISALISPGLNVMYGDMKGNIAWWASGRLVKRAAHVDPVTLVDGSYYANDPVGYFDFSMNPHAVNPPSGFVYSANNQPDSMPGMGFYPGYYVPEDRALRIRQLFAERNQLNPEDLHRFNLDVNSPVTPLIAEAILSAMRNEVKKRTELHINAAKQLLLWDGDHELRDIAPTIYYKLIYHVLAEAMKDELGEDNFKLFLSTHVMKTSLIHLVKNDSSVWWNNVNSRDIVESRTMIFEKAFDQTIAELKAQLGNNTDMWEWGRVHMLEHKHPIGMKKPFNILFNVGPLPVPGGPEVLNQMGFDLNGEGVYHVKYGPAMRIVIDMADVENSKSILPSGQSGNVMSRYYNDQASMFNTGKMRKQKMNRSEIEANRIGRLVFRPK